MVILVMDREEKIRKVFVWAAKRSGFGQYRIAEILGCSQPNVSQLMHGRHYIKEGYLEKLAKAMGSDIAALVYDYENDPLAETAQPTPSDTSLVRRRSTDTGNMVELSEHQIMVTRFKDPERGKEINETLLKIEELDPDALDEINSTLKIKLDFLKGRHSSPTPAQRDNSSAS